ncbi:hypothetical protein WJX72_010665 [[Myrmecia] bisecta]|uniref:Uncharacterized protein n=1 Tax=[Myrmecia] bisecta TaxID=41462 RepID=A0AAW1QSK6_9CHLO
MRCSACVRLAHLAVAWAVLSAAVATAYPENRYRIPNGNRVPCPPYDTSGPCSKENHAGEVVGYCLGLGHTKCKGGGPLNAFGKDFAEAGQLWTKELCEKDSDGDGQTNGEELGDPCCVWHPKLDESELPAHLKDYAVSHPGNAASLSPDPILRGSEACQLDHTKHHGSSLEELTFHNARWVGGNDTYFVFDFLIEDFEIPTNETNYVDFLFNLPSNATYDIVSIEAIIGDAGKTLLHHIDLRPCSRLTEAPGTGMVQHGGHATAPGGCGDVVYIFVPGTKAWGFPAEAGLRCGKGTERRAFNIGAHYHNPDHLSGQVDRSGLRLHLTTNLRKGDIGMLWAGAISGLVGSIPPGHKSWYSSTSCRVQLDRTQYPGGIHFFTHLPHIHKLGYRLWSDHMRMQVVQDEFGHQKSRWVKIGELGREEHYSYKAGRYGNLGEPGINVLPGDMITTTCIYDSTNQTEVIRGGLGSNDEMCIHFLFYYPADAYGANRQCIGTIHSGDLPGGAMAMQDFVEEEPIAADWYTALADGRIMCERAAMPDELHFNKILETVQKRCGDQWKNLRDIHVTNGIWNRPAPAECSPDCARFLYNLMACSAHHNAVQAGSLLDATMLLEPYVDRACSQFLVNGELREQHEAETAPDIYGPRAKSKFAQRA